MSEHALADISKLEDSLWEAADQLRANSKLTSSEYCMPILGIIFLRHATNRYNAVVAKIEEEKAAGRMPKKLPITKAHFISRRALMLPETARYDHLISLPKGTNLGGALVEAMDAIEADFVPLAGQLPKDFEKFDNDLLEEMLRIFDSETLRRASGDIFGRIYEYFRMKFALQGAQDNGEFFTPPSLVQTIVNVIEPDHGVVFDPACGSGGMFVQSSHFIEDHGEDTMGKVTFYGQEKTATTIRLAKMNLAVHGLEGEIREANTFYEDEHRLSDGRALWGNCDFVMANPPFNVDMVDEAKVKGDRRLPFGLPGVNKKKKAVSNANYLWISYFHSYLNATGRAGFVMSSQASSAGHGEAEVRRKIVESGDVDVMMSIRSGFFYTRTVPCELWFFDKGKPEARKDTVLMLDARNVGRKLAGSRKVWEFSPEQLANLTAVVWLYRGERRRFAQLVWEHRAKAAQGVAQSYHAITVWNPDFSESGKMHFLVGCLSKASYADWLSDEARKEEKNAAAIGRLKEIVKILKPQPEVIHQKARELHGVLEGLRDSLADGLDLERDAPEQVAGRIAATCDRAEGVEKEVKAFLAQVANFDKTVRQGADIVLKELGGKRWKVWKKDWDMPTKLEVVGVEVAIFREAYQFFHDFLRQVRWLLSRFPEAEFMAVPGLCKAVTRAEIAEADWSLTPGRYVGVAPVEEDEDFDFGETMREIHTELKTLNAEAAKLAAKIQVNFEGLGV